MNGSWREPWVQKVHVETCIIDTKEADHENPPGANTLDRGSCGAYYRHRPYSTYNPYISAKGEEVGVILVFVYS